MSKNPAAAYAEALNALSAARDEVEAEFASAKAARQAAPADEDAKVRYVAARDALQEVRAVDRAGREGVGIGDDAVASVEA